MGALWRLSARGRSAAFLWHVQVLSQLPARSSARAAEQSVRWQPGRNRRAAEYNAVAALSSLSPLGEGIHQRAWSPMVQRVFISWFVALVFIAQGLGLADDAAQRAKDAVVVRALLRLPG